MCRTLSLLIVVEVSDPWSTSGDVNRVDVRTMTLTISFPSMIGSNPIDLNSANRSLKFWKRVGHSSSKEGKKGDSRSTVQIMLCRGIRLL